MKYLEEFLKSLNSSIAISIAIIAGITTLAGTVYNLVKNVKSKKSTSETLKDIQDKLDKLTENFKILIDDRDKKIFLHDLKMDIKQIGTIFVKNSESVEFSKMIISGIELSTSFFKDIYTTGYDKIDSNMIKFQALGLLSNIRNTHLGSDYDSTDFIQIIKNTIALPLIENLCTSLEMIKSGMFGTNGERDKEFKKICLTFIQEFLQRSSHIFIKK